MNDYGLTKDEFNIIHNLFDITKDIFNELNTLSKEEDKNIVSNYYQLNELLGSEKYLYENINPDVLYNILDYIRQSDRYFDEINIKYAQNEYYNIFLLKARIINKLGLYIDMYEQEDMENDEPTEFNDLDLCKNIIVEDILNISLKILQEYINDSAYQNIKDKLLNFKYRLAFIFDSIFDKLLLNNFKIHDDVYLKIGMSNAFLQLSDNVKEELFDETVEDIIKEQLETMMGIYEAATYDNATLIISHAIIRSAIIFGSDIIINRYKDILENYCINDEDVYKLIDNAFNNLNNDRNIPKFILINRK